MTSNMTVAVIGGTGNLGWALARRWARAGVKVVIGSRSQERAAEAAGRIKSPSGARKARGMTNEAAADAADVIVVTVPFGSQKETLSALASRIVGKLVVDTTVPLVPPKVARVQLPPQGSAAQAAQEILGDAARVTSAFHNVAAHRLSTDGEIDCDILVFGDTVEDRDIVVELASAAGLRGIHGGPLANSAAAEAITSVLIGINKRYKADGAGIRITGLSVS
ncbi:MAG: NADPH-dependent F420 reductase [Pseudomonadota bacterium]|nr:NADPH-dependent F420 reductase [Pseudomonadota bacterium]